MTKHHKHPRDSQTGKPLRKPFHFKLYKNPYETLLAIRDAGKKKSQVAWYLIFILGIMGGGIMSMNLKEQQCHSTL
jgi:hypothetical protein